MTRSWLWLGLGLAGCAGAPEQESAKQAQPIINGQLDHTDLFAVGVGIVPADPDAGYYNVCTGTLVGPQTVVTAGHCTDDVEPGSFTYVTTASTLASDNRYARVDAVLTNPAYSTRASVNTHDLGMLHLESPLPGPYPRLNTLPLDRLDLKRHFRVIGYGLTAPDKPESIGTRHQVTRSAVQVLNGGELTVGPELGTVCPGDSGGPWLMALDDGSEVFAATSVRTDVRCAQLGYATRTDSQLAFIRGFMVAHGDVPSCEADGRCGWGCASPDPDCPCEGDGFCTAACATPASDPDCPQSCLFDGGTCLAPPDAGPPVVTDPGTGGGCASSSGLELAALLGLLGLRRASRW